MTLQEPYDDAMFDFSRGDFDRAIAKLKAVLAQEPAHFERPNWRWAWPITARATLTAAIREGHKAEHLRPKEQLVHTNLSLFYMKSGDKVTAEHHGLQARIAGFGAKTLPRAKQPGPRVTGRGPELEIAEAANRRRRSCPQSSPRNPGRKRARPNRLATVLARRLPA